MTIMKLPPEIMMIIFNYRDAAVDRLKMILEKHLQKQRTLYASMKITCNGEDEYSIYIMDWGYAICWTIDNHYITTKFERSSYNDEGRLCVRSYKHVALI